MISEPCLQGLDGVKPFIKSLQPCDFTYFPDSSFWERWKLSLVELRNSNKVLNNSKIICLHCLKEEKSWRWFDIRHSSWVWLKSRKKDFYVLFTNGYRTPGNVRWELESRLAKETFFRARFEAKQKPISRPCPSLACLLSSSLFSYGGGALRCTAAATSRQFSSKKSSLSIYFIDNISIRQAVGTEGVQVGHLTPPPSRFCELYK